METPFGFCEALGFATMYSFLLDNIGLLVALVIAGLFNLFTWLAKRHLKEREQERYGHYPPAVRSGRLNYEEYKKRRES